MIDLKPGLKNDVTNPKRDRRTNPRGAWTNAEMWPAGMLFRVLQYEHEYPRIEALLSRRSDYVLFKGAESDRDDVYANYARALVEAFEPYVVSTVDELFAAECRRGFETETLQHLINIGKVTLHDVREAMDQAHAIAAAEWEKRA